MLLFADSFDHYGTVIANMLAGMWADLTGGGYVTISNAFARTGTYSLKLQGSGGAEARFSLLKSAFTCGVGFGIYMPSLPSLNNTMTLQFRNASNVDLLTLCFQSDGSIAAKKGDENGTLIDISDSILTAGTFNHIECKAVFDNVAGYVEVRVNGVIKLQIGSLNLGIVACTQAALHASNEAVYFDDVFAWDDTGTYNNDFMGAQRILTIFPTGNTAQADWSWNGAASGYLCINEAAPDADTTYLSSPTVGNKSDFSLPSLPPELVQITGVMIPAMARIDAAGIGNLKVTMKSSAALLAGASMPLTPGYSYYRNAFEYDPNTSAPWTKAALEAALVRVEKSL